jgi:hypothetical protein
MEGCRLGDIAERRGKTLSGKGFLKIRGQLIIIVNSAGLGNPEASRQ